MSSFYENTKEQIFRLQLTNYTPLQCLMIMILITYGSKTIHATLSFLLNGYYDNVQASFRYASIESQKNWKTKTVARAYNAHLNHFEALLLYSIVIFSGVITNVTNDEFFILANAFLTIRVIYNIVYVLAFNKPLGAVRSAVWTIGAIVLIKMATIAVF